MRQQEDIARRLLRTQRAIEVRERAAAEAERRILEVNQKKERIWKVTKDKITFEAPSPDYYSRTPFKPGVHFFLALVQAAQQSRVKLEINIPDMLLFHSHIFWLRTESRFLKVFSEFKLMEFYRLFQYTHGQEHGPTAVLRVPTNNEAAFKAIPLSYAEFADTILKSQFPNLGIVQKYVRFNGTHPAIVRLFLINQTKDQRATHGWSIFNKDETVQGSYPGKHLVMSDGVDSVDVVKLQGTTLQPYIIYGHRIVEMLEAFFAVRIEEIVFDFLRDERDGIWFLGCQGFRIDESVLLAREMKTKLMAQFSAHAVNEFIAMEHDQRLAEVHCKLCLLPFKSRDITNTLPYKTLLLFKERTVRKRKCPMDLSHLRIVSADYLTHSIRVCELCYSLVLAECELIHAEKSLASIMDVPMEAYDVMNPKVYSHPTYLPARLHQWRVLLYFHSLETDVQMDGCVLKYQLFGQSFTRPLPKPFTGELNFAALHYFFGDKSSRLREACHSIEVPIEIRPSLVSKHILASSSSRVFSSFTFQMEDNTGLHQEMHLHMFRNEMESGKLKLVVGLACDSQVEIKELQSTIARFTSFYVPERSYFGSEQLPEAWMEVFVEGYKQDLNSLVLDSSEEVEKMYSPLLSLRQVTPSRQTKRLSHTITAPALKPPKPVVKSLRPSKPISTLRSTRSTTSTKAVHDEDMFWPTALPSPQQKAPPKPRRISPIIEHHIDDSADDWHRLLTTGTDFQSTENRVSTLPDFEDEAVDLGTSVGRYLTGKTVDNAVKHLQEVVKMPEARLESTPFTAETDMSLIPTMTTIELLPRPSSSFQRHKRVASALQMKGKEEKHKAMMRTYSIKGKSSSHTNLV